MNLSLHTFNSETTKHNSPRPKMLSEKETTRSDNDVPFSNRGVGMYDFFHLSFGHTFLTPKIISENHKTIHRQIRISLRKTNWPDLSIRQPNFKKRHDLPVPKNHSEKIPVSGSPRDRHPQTQSKNPETYEGKNFRMRQKYLFRKPDKSNSYSCGKMYPLNA